MNLRRLLEFIGQLFKFTAAERKDVNKQMAFDRSQSARRRAAGLVGHTPLGLQMKPGGYLSSKTVLG